MTATCYPVTTAIRTTEPTWAQEPITLAEAKHQCGIAEEVTYHDQFITSLVRAAREQVEKDSRQIAATGAFTWNFTEFGWREWLELPDIRPITAVGVITYIATDGTTTTWGSSNYTLGNKSIMAKLHLAYGSVWPTVRGDIDGVTLNMTAGYANAAAVPERFKQAMKYLINHWFASRDTVSIGTISPEISMTYESLIEGLRRSTYA